MRPIDLTCFCNYQELWPDPYEDEVISIQYNGRNHFVALKPNTAYFKAVETVLLTQFGFFKPQDASLTSQLMSDATSGASLVSKIIIGYLGSSDCGEHPVKIFKRKINGEDQATKYSVL